MAAVGHWHSIKRELWALGWDEDDLDQGNLLVHDLVSIVHSCASTSALFRDLDAWTKGDQLLANLGEQQAGLVSLQRRHQRPGVPLDPARQHTHQQVAASHGNVSRSKVDGFQSMELDEWVRFRDANYALGDAVELGRRNQPKIDAQLKKAAENKKAQDRLRQNALLTA